MRIYIAFSLLFLSMTVIGQSRKKKEFIAASGYKDIIVTDTIIWALDVNGTLKSFSSTGNELTLDISIKPPITSIHKTNGDTLIFICDRNVILFNTKTFNYNFTAKLPQNTIFLTRDSNRQIWASTEKGILNVSTNKKFIPDSTLNHYYKWLLEPSACILDSNGFLWIGFDKGEWGGNLQTFDTKLNRFITPIFNDSLACLAPVNSLIQINSQIYVADAVAHGSTSSCITRFENFHAKHVFNSNYENNYREIIFGMPQGEYINTIAYSQTRDYIYYVYQTGIYKAKPGTKTANIDAWSLVINPYLGTTDGRPRRVSKMLFTSDDKLVLLIPNYAFALWDGRIMRLIP